MSMLPVSSSRELLQSIAVSRLNRDDSDQDFGKMLLTDIATQSVTNIAKANRMNTESSVQCVKTLVEDLGYDRDDKLVTDMIDADTKIRGVLVSIGEQIPRLLRAN